MKLIEYSYKTLGISSCIVSESNKRTVQNLGFEDLPEVLVTKLRNALKQMQNRKSSDEVMKMTIQFVQRRTCTNF